MYKNPGENFFFLLLNLNVISIPFFFFDYEENKKK